MKKSFLSFISLFIMINLGFSQDKENTDNDQQNLSEGKSLNTSIVQQVKSDCKNVIIRNEINNNGIQFLKTKSQTLVKRGNYRYAIELINGPRRNRSQSVFFWWGKIRQRR